MVCRSVDRLRTRICPESRTLVDTTTRYKMVKQNTVCFLAGRLVNIATVAQG